LRQKNEVERPDGEKAIICNCMGDLVHGGVVVSAIRFCKVASEMGVVGFLRGPSAWTQKTPPLQLSTGDAKFECDALARRVLTPLTEAQLKDKRPRAKDLPYTFQAGKTDYE
jgi:myo-inositol-1-phosphate synthase